MFRIPKKSKNHDDSRVLLVGIVLTLFLYYVVGPQITNSCIVHDDNTITWFPKQR